VLPLTSEALAYVPLNALLGLPRSALLGQPRIGTTRNRARVAGVHLRLQQGQSPARPLPEFLVNKTTSSHCPLNFRDSAESQHSRNLAALTVRDEGSGHAVVPCQALAIH
jgi:hypothetical protein